MINDLAKVMKFSEISLFADDFEVYKVITDINDQLKLQYDLHQIQSWATENGFEVNLQSFLFIKISLLNILIC